MTNRAALTGGLLPGSAPQRPALLRVAIPHFCQPDERLDTGYGSSRNDASLLRTVALSRCIGSILALARGYSEEIFGIANANILNCPVSIHPISQLAGVMVDCHVFVTGKSFLGGVLSGFDRRIKVHYLDLEDPRHLPRAARDFLIEDNGPGEADHSIYLEDDLVIQDRLFADKLVWFCERTNHQFTLMPHRFELTGSALQPRFFVDGPINLGVFPKHHQPCKDVASGQFWDGQNVFFDIASNPHSGSFNFSSVQRKMLQQGSCSNEGFIGPLETIATYTVLEKWAVMKPSWQCRDFLLIEHAHPSFLEARFKLSSHK